MDVLFKLFDVTFAAPHQGDADPMEMTAGIPGSVTTVLTAEQVLVTALIEADSLAEAGLLGELAVGPFARTASAAMSVRPRPGTAENP